MLDYIPWARLTSRLLVGGLFATFACLAQDVTLSLASGSAPPGTTLVLDLSLTATSTVSTASLEWTINYPTTDFLSATVQAGPAAVAAQKTVSCASASPGTSTCLLYGLNTTPITSGVVATVSLTISSSTTGTSSPIQLSNGSAADPTGVGLTVSTTGSTIGIIQPALNGFTCDAISLASLASTTCTVALTAAAEGGGAVVALAVAPSSVNLPASVTIPQGATSASFTASAGTVATTTPVTLTASYASISETFGLTINPPPAALSGVSVSPNTVVSGQSSTGTVTLTAPAGSGGAMVSLSSSNGAAAVPQSVIVPQGASSATFAASTGSVTTATSVVLTASYSGVSQMASLTINPPPAALSGVSVSPTAVVSGQSSTGTVTLTAPAGSGGAMVSLSSSNPAATVPQSVIVPQGASSATFTVTTGSVTTATSVVLTASYSGVSQTASLTINPPPAVLSRVSVNPNTVVSGQSSTGTATLTAPAGIGGAMVSLSSSNPAATVPQSVIVPQGASSATFTVTTGSVATATSVVLTASYSGVNQTAGLTINPPPAALGGVSVSPTTVVGGQSSTGTVTLTAPAGSGGAVVSLSSSNAAVAIVPQNVTVAQGAKSTTFTVGTGSVNAPTSAVVTGSYAGVSKTASLTVNPPPAALSGVSLNPTAVVSGQSSTITVTLTAAAGSGGAVVSISTSNNAAAKVPQSVTVPPGATSTTFSVKAGQVKTTTSVTITASYSGVTMTAVLNVNPSKLASAPITALSTSARDCFNSPLIQNWNLGQAAGMIGAEIQVSSAKKTAGQRAVTHCSLFQGNSSEPAVDPGTQQRENAYA